MAFPWALFERLSLASGNIVEDMKLTVDLVRIGVMPHFCANVSVFSSFPSSEDATHAQRKRWEHGHIATVFKYGLPALAESVFALDSKRVALALDICVPPLSLLMMLFTSVVLVVGLVLYLFGIGQLAFTMMLLSGGAMLLGLLLVWFRFGRHLVTVKMLVMIPAYVISKLSLYLAYLTSRQHDWNRTERD